MKALLLAGLWLALANSALAHRLDEYLQAARLSVTTNRIDFSLDLTPGVAVADQLLATIDKDRDGLVSEDERATYGQRVLKDLRLQLDEKELALHLVEVSVPMFFEIRNGVGVIRIRASASVGQLATGKHVLHLTNGHLPAISVYLVNALASKDPAVQVTKQTRDELQKEYRLEFGVNPAR